MLQIHTTSHPPSVKRQLFICLLSLLFAFSIFTSSFSSIPKGQSAALEAARLVKVSPHSYAGYTRLTLALNRTVTYSVATIEGGRVRITLEHTESPLFKRLKGYHDANVANLDLKRRGESVVVTVRPVDVGSGYRVLDEAGGNVVTIDIGPLLKESRQLTVLPGRERILTESVDFFKHFDPPLRPEVPFQPTTRVYLNSIMPKDDVRQFALGESDLYKGKPAEAEGIFKSYLGRELAIRALALYRLAEAYYLLQRYGDAITTFQEAERTWPDFMAYNPASAFFYADAVIRSGDYERGRKRLLALIASIADTPSAPQVAARLAEIMEKRGYEMTATAIYLNLRDYFPNDKAAQMAELKMADRQFFKVDRGNFSELQARYQKLYDKGLEFNLRQEAFFKSALLEGLFGNTDNGIEGAREYEHRYPKGPYLTLMKAMREELILVGYRERFEKKNFPDLIKLVEANREYLPRCLADPLFIPRLVEAYRATGMLRSELALYHYLIGREWAQTSAPLMYMRIIDDAMALSDNAMAESACRNFIFYFPNHEKVWLVREKLGWVVYQKGSLRETVDELNWILDGKHRPEIPESWYYLGKAWLSMRQPIKGARAMAAFITTLKEKKRSSPLLSDAYFSVAVALADAGERKASLSWLKTGAEYVVPEMQDQFIYKMAELQARWGDTASARGNWKIVAEKGTDPLWKKMAAQALDNLDVKEKLDRGLN